MKSEELSRRVCVCFDLFSLLSYMNIEQFIAWAHFNGVLPLNGSFIASFVLL